MEKRKEHVCTSSAAVRFSGAQPAPMLCLPTIPFGLRLPCDPERQHMAGCPIKRDKAVQDPPLLVIIIIIIMKHHHCNVVGGQPSPIPVQPVGSQ